MKYQIYWQNKKDSNDLCNIGISENYDINTRKEEIDGWLKRTTKDFPPPEGYQFLICNENSEDFSEDLSTYKGRIVSEHYGKCLDEKKNLKNND